MKTDLNLLRRRLVFGAAAAGVATAANAEVRTDTAPRVLDGQPMPEPSDEQTAGPVALGADRSSPIRLRLSLAQLGELVGLSRWNLPLMGQTLSL
jgi:hypothetical protein